MLYSDIVLSDRPVSYWSGPQISRSNLIPDEKSSLDSISWIEAIGSSSYSATSSDYWSGNKSLLVQSQDSSLSGIAIKAGSRILCGASRYYTMVVRAKNISGNRSLRFQVRFFTTQTGSTLSEPITYSEYFDISSSEWTTIYKTITIPASQSSQYYAAWGVESNSGSIGDEFLIDGIQFFEGDLYSLYDIKSGNDALLRSYTHLNSKPIIFNGDPATRLDYNSFIEIDNAYKYFIKGKERQEFSIDLWFTLNKNPSLRHNLLSVGDFAKCYIEKDRIYIERSDGERSSIRVNSWSMQHYINFYYREKTIGLYLDGQEEMDLSLGTDFEFSDTLDFITPSIVIGPSSIPQNLIYPNPHLTESFWTDINSSSSIITSDYYSGGSCLEVVKQSVNNSGVSLSNLVPLGPYKNYTASVYVKIPSGAEQSNIKLKLNIYDSLFEGNNVQTYEDSQLISSSDGWVRLSTSFYSDIYHQSAEFIVEQEQSGTDGEVFLVDSPLLENNMSASYWDDSLYNSDPLYVSGIAFYPHVLNLSQINKRISYAINDDLNGSVIEKGADIFDISYQTKALPSLEYKPSENENFESANVTNFIKSDNKIRQNYIPNEFVSSGNLGGYAILDHLGIKFTNDSYIYLRNASSYFNPRSSTIRLQMELQDTSGDGTILFMYPAIGYDGVALQKINNKIVFSSVLDGVSTELMSSPVLSSGLVNIALNFNENEIFLKVNDGEFSTSDIEIQTPTQIYLGNIPETLNSAPDYIRNLCFDELTEFNQINWLSSGLYMLRFNGNLNVSQKSEFYYEFFPTTTSNNSLIYYNTPSNNLVYVNDELVYEQNFIPSFNYDSPDLTSIRVISETDDSVNDIKNFSDSIISIYDSSSIDSSLGNFFIQARYVDGNIYQDEYDSSYGGFYSQPYIMKYYKNNILSHDDNLGIKFIRESSSGCKIVSNSSSYQMIEFMFKLNNNPKKEEDYTIFDIDNIYKLYYSDLGLKPTGSYELYIDGEEVSPISGHLLNSEEFYHICIVLPQAEQYDVYLGSDSLESNGANASIGNIVVYQSLPLNYQDFISRRYLDAIGRDIKSISGGNLIVRDSEDGTQEISYNISRDYYKMKLLPKVKIIAEV